MRFVVLVCLAVVALALAGLKAAGLLTRSPATPRQLARALLAEYPGALPARTATGSTGEALFTDVAPAMGIRFLHDTAARGSYFLPEEMGPGGGFLDYDGDGDLDVFVAGGGRIARTGDVQTCRLFRNDLQDGEGVFRDVTLESGAGVAGHAFGVACADYDDDGDVDVFVSRLGADALLRNDGAGRFTEVAAEIGLGDPGFGASAAFLDLDRDGDLDLYVTRYVRWSADAEAPCYTILGVRDYCNPVLYGPTTDRLYRNRGDGSFDDVTEASGIGAERGNGLAVGVSDFDGDGWPDLYIANDQTPAFLWHNNGDGTFENVAAMSGCAYDASGVAIAGMGVACEDLDDDGDLDLLVTNIRMQTHLVLRNENGLFEDIGARSGVAAWSIPATAFGVAVFDQDHDGRLDAFFANGEVNVDNQLRVSENPYAQPDQFVRIVDGVLVDETPASGAAFADVGRGVASGDFDGDGDVDLLVTNNGGPVRLLRNENTAPGAWLIVDARTGPARRAAIGARITLTAGGRRFIREIRPQQSYLSSGDPRAHFGLGGLEPAAAIEKLEVLWADGTTTVISDVSANRVIVVEQEATMETPTGGPAP